MNIKEFREVLTEIGKLNPTEAKTLFDKAGDTSVTDKELGEALKGRISKNVLQGLGAAAGKLPIG
jgi:hypothetical protein